MRRNNSEFEGLRAPEHLQRKEMPITSISRSTIETIQAILDGFSLPSLQWENNELGEREAGLRLTLTSLLDIAASSLARELRTGVRLEIDSPELIRDGRSLIVSNYWQETGGLSPRGAIKLPMSANSAIGNCYLQTGYDFSSRQISELKSVTIPAIGEHLYVGYRVFQAIETTRENLESARNQIDELLPERDTDTEAHTIRLIFLSLLTWQRLRQWQGKPLERKEAVWMAEAARNHDLGKILIASLVIHSPDSFEDKPWVWSIMDSHIEKGVLLAGYLGYDSAVLRAIGEHHENFNGTGKPNGLFGQGEISLLGLILRAVDFFDALASPRSYKKASEPLFILDTMRSQAGYLFDPEVVAVLDEIHRQDGIIDCLYQPNNQVAPADLLAVLTERGLAEVFLQAAPRYFQDITDLNAHFPPREWNRS